MDLPVVVVSRHTRGTAGSCNFCTRDHTEVNEMRSRDPSRTLVVRFCDLCWDELPAKCCNGGPQTSECATCKQ